MLNPPKTPQRRMNFRRANRSMPKRRFDIPTHEIDFKNTELLKKFTTEAGKILSRRTTGVATHIHRKITSAIKRARSVLLMK